MILGESGSGKSRSLKYFDPNKIGVFNISGKPFPFKGNKLKVIQRPSYSTILQVLQNPDRKVNTFCVDDSQHLMAYELLATRAQTGYNKFYQLAYNFNNLIEVITKLPDDVIVYFLHHSDKDEDGFIRAKSCGKMLENQINIGSLFTIVLRCIVEDGQHRFQTHNIDGSSITKSPEGLFEQDYIENDLAYVDDCIRNYYFGD